MSTSLKKGLLWGILAVLVVGMVIAILFATGAFKSDSTEPTEQPTDNSPAATYSGTSGKSVGTVTVSKSSPFYLIKYESADPDAKLTVNAYKVDGEERVSVGTILLGEPNEYRVNLSSVQSGDVLEFYVSCVDGISWTLKVYV